MTELDDEASRTASTQDESDELKGRINDLNERLRANARLMPRPPLRTRAERRAFDQWLKRREDLLAKHESCCRRMSELLLPLRTPSPGGPAALFDSHLLLPFEDRPTKVLMFQQFFNRPEGTGRFLRNSMLYERIFIPTVDFLALTLLFTIVPDIELIEALKQGEIVFVRYKGAVGYVGVSAQVPLAA